MSEGGYSIDYRRFQSPLLQALEGLSLDGSDGERVLGKQKSDGTFGHLFTW